MNPVDPPQPTLHLPLNNPSGRIVLGRSDFARPDHEMVRRSQPLSDGEETWPTRSQRAKRW
jgi:hypothetical protein